MLATEYINKLSLKKKFIILICFFILLSCSGIGVLVIHNERVQSYQKLLDHGKSLAAIIANNSEYALYIEDQEYLHQLAESIQSNPDITYLSVINQLNDVLIYKSKLPSLKQPQIYKSIPKDMEQKIYHSEVVDHENNKRFIDILAPVMSAGKNDFAGIFETAADSSTETSAPGEDKIIGYIQLGVNQDRYHQQMGNFLAAIAKYTFLIVLLGVLLAFFISKYSVKPILLTTDMLKDISQGEGDLTKRLTIETKDEIGRLAGYFNNFVEKLHSVIVDIADYVIRLSGAAENLDAASEKMAANTTNISSQLSAMSSTAEHMSDTTQKAVINSEEVSSIFSGVAVSAEQMEASVYEIAKNTKQGSQIATDADSKAQSAVSIMQDLHLSSNEISSVLNQITDIADQTNLLALNATIEAARAGEQGKGFAVVANEVKELAKQTTLSAKQIAQQIREMQEKTDNAVGAIEKITVITSKINTISQAIADSVENQLTVTSEIANNISNASGTAQEITNSIQEVAHGAQMIAGNITEANKAAQESATGASETNTSASELYTMASHLEKLVEQFKVKK